MECFLVRGTGGDILGFVQYHVAENGAEGGGLDLVVTPAARRHGVGRATATAVVAFLRRERGWNRVTVDPDLSNERGTAFWQAVGFAIEEQVDNDPTRGPYLIMQATAQVEG